MSELLDIKTIAFNLNVSRQTIYNHIDKNSKELQGNIRKVQGVTYLNEEGVKTIKKSMGLIKPPTQVKEFNVDEIIKQITDDIKINNKEDIEDLKKDIKKDAEQKYNKLESEIEELKKQNEDLIRLIEKQQEENKRSIWDIFRRK